MEKFFGFGAGLVLGLAAITIAVAPASAASAQTSSYSTNPYAIGVFLAFVVLSLVITRWAAKQTTSKSSFLVAGGAIKPWQNGLAIAGDFMSAATFLGITGLMFLVGYDAYILASAVLIGWPLMLMLIAERFRNMGSFTLVDVVRHRLKPDSVRLLLACSSLCVILFYLTGQMVGAGKLIELLFGMSYIWSVVTVSALIMVYVLFGGMIATTWIQMIKAVLLLTGGIALAFFIFAEFNFEPDSIFALAATKHQAGAAVLAPGGWLKNDFFNVATVGLSLCFGLMGLPHVLMRFFTVKDARDARNSVAIATLLMAVFYLLVLFIGFGAIALLIGQPEFFDADGQLVGGTNMVAMHLADLLGGSVFLGFMAAVSFATILAVVAGLTLAGAATIAHDIVGVLSKGDARSDAKQLFHSRLATVFIAATALLVCIVFEDQNIAVVTAIALAIAASVNFPILLLTLYWRNLSSRGLVIGGWITLTVSIVLIVLSDTVWVQLLGYEKAIFPYIYPTIFTLPLGFATVWIISILDKSAQAKAERAGFDDQMIAAEIGKMPQD
ncbi:MAG: cation acetate symporter [Erythrobacter sp.]